MDIETTKELNSAFKFEHQHAVEQALALVRDADNMRSNYLADPNLHRVRAMRQMGIMIKKLRMDLPRLGRQLREGEE